MTVKPKSFPLSLAALSEQGMRGGSKRSGARQSFTPTKSASTQTASRNAADTQHAILKAAPANRSAAQMSQAPPTVRPHVMVSDGIRHAMVARLAKQGIKDAKVLSAMAAIPRHLFLQPALASQAYIDASLPIGHQQTISQPYIVARMIEVLRDQAGALTRVLEIGTGCGYQAAVLSAVAKDVYSIERIKPLHELAKTNLRPLRIPNIRLHYGDGMLGLPQVAPFDAIILAAAGMDVPQALLEQMAIGGRLVAPVGGERQVLQLVERKSRHEWITTVLEDCHFVPLRPGTIG